MTSTASGSDAWPRDAANRYRIYTLRRPFSRGAAEVVATTPTPEGIGVALVTLADDGVFDGAVVGVLDTLAEPGSGNAWVVCPYEAVRS